MNFPKREKLGSENSDRKIKEFSDRAEKLGISKKSSCPRIFYYNQSCIWQISGYWRIDFSCFQFDLDVVCFCFVFFNVLEGSDRLFIVMKLCERNRIFYKFSVGFLML